MSIISTDAIIPFMPRTAHTPHVKPNLSINRIGKDTKLKNDLKENSRQQPDLTAWLLAHHQTQGSPEQNKDMSNQAENSETEGHYKHIDTLV